jgi:SpoVK/Ycf46/Vps4 family AAA+-type ATPase
VRFVGPGVTVFGNGPDGGREAAYTGSFRMTTGETWTGQTVIQAKFRRDERDPADNLAWLRDHMSAELKRWGDPTSQRRTRGQLPDNLIVVSNVSLTSSAGGGIDTANMQLKRLADKHELRLRNWRVWPAQQLTALLDNAHSIRSAYAGFLTPGDVLGQIAERLDLHDEDLTAALTSHVVKEMLLARWVALDSMGQEERDRVNLGRVAVDLPARRLEDTRDRHALAALVEHVDTVPKHRPVEEPPHLLLVGGPGQGKTTLTALLAQLYRVALLQEAPNLG